MQSRDIRAGFLRYFEDLGHRVVPSSSLVPAGDPTLFFANAGMNQFKDVFTGQATREYVRAASSQKCLRVSGKHNDFETVGRSPRHHTFFEMLGNFSFGDYFKRDAIAWAWRLVTERWGIDGARLVATVFEDDDEAEGIWQRDIGLGAGRVFRLGADDNYWSMGDVGPQGPCSEIYLDRGIECGRADCSPACACGRYFEFWNLVFMQFERDASGAVTRLPKPSIDTGMGLDRVATILQGVHSNYDTDLFQPLIAEIARRSGIAHVPLELGDEVNFAREERVSMRVVADHVRALTFLVADGVFPSNEGRGYVLRKLLRRASAHAGRIGMKAPCLSELSAIIVANMGDAYPELKREAGAIAATVRREELAFEATLAQGSALLDEIMAGATARGEKRVSGADAFLLHDTHGLPIEYTAELARERGLGVDRDGFERRLQEQKERARAAARTIETAMPRIPADARVAPTAFLGYVETSTDGCRVEALLGPDGMIEALGEGETGWVVLDRTPFYAESGGQVGDTGVLAGDRVRMRVRDTQALQPGVTGHAVIVEHGGVRVGDALNAEVDAARRRRIMANHTATHLLHAALREVLGDSARQAGSLVAPDRLRFDFTAGEPTPPETLREIEQRVNARILGQRPVTRREMPHAEAIAAGAVAMFGEKYGDVVRVIAVDDWSVELCGGTHCERTEQIGGLRILSERGVASGVRRIEAITGAGLIERLSEDEDLLARLEGAVKAPRTELLPAVHRLADQVKALRRELDDARKQAATASSGPRGEAIEVAGLRLESRLMAGLDVNALREIAEGLREQAGLDGLAIGSEKDGKVALIVALRDSAAARLGGEAAREIVAVMAKDVGGGGGGRAELAWAGGKNAAGLAAALARFPKLVGERAAGATA